MMYRLLAGSRLDGAPPPSQQTLLRPLRWSAASLAAVIVPPTAFNVVVSPWFVGDSKTVRWTPELDVIQSSLAVLGVTSLLVLVAMIVRRVRPLWSSMTALRKLLYVGVVIVAQIALIVAGEAALFVSRGGPVLFGPRLVDAAVSSESGARAYAYQSCLLGCSYEIFVAEPHALVTHRRSSLSRRSVNERVTLRWDAENEAQLVDAEGAVLRHEPFRLPLFRSGC